MSNLQQAIEIKDDYVKRYFEIISNCGICKKSNEYAEKIDHIENLIKQLEVK